MQALSIRRRTYTRLLAYARKQMPSEAVSLLSGTRPDLVTAFEPLANLVPEHGFFVHPREQYNALMAMRRQGRTLIGTFHSHPGGSATLSDADVQYLGQWKCVHVVASLWDAADRPDTVAAFIIDGRSWRGVSVQLA